MILIIGITEFQPIFSQRFFVEASPNYPAIVPSDLTAAKLIINTGVTLQFPVLIPNTIPNGIVNNGIINLNGSGQFSGAFHILQTQITGTGKVVIGNPGISYYGWNGTMNNTLEINSSGRIQTNGGSFSGSLLLTNGIVFVTVQLTDFKMTNPNANITYSDSSYCALPLVRAINASGTYEFPVAQIIQPGLVITPLQLAKVTLNNITGPQTISVKFTKVINGSAPNVLVNGVMVTELLNGGFWTVTPNVSLTGGNYSIHLEERGFTNRVTDSSRYVILKRANSSSPWTFAGDNGGASQTASVVSATLNNLNEFSDFAIGIASGSIPLPIEGLTLDAKKRGGDIILNWKTVEETEVSYFEVENSLDGRNWVVIKQMKIDKPSVSDYTFTHLQPLKCTHFYRIKQVSRENKELISNTVVVKMTSGETDFLAYPKSCIG